MNDFETAAGTEPERGEDIKYDVEDALVLAGLSHAEAPKKGTPAYERLIAAAQDYMYQVKLGENSSRQFGNGGDSENYPRPRKKDEPSSDHMRRECHDRLAKMLLGVPRNGLPKSTADQISNFAAYVTGDEEYIDRW